MPPNSLLCQGPFYDAVNGITQTHESFLSYKHGKKKASAEAAAAAAAHEVLIHLYPARKPIFDMAYLEALIQLGNTMVENARLFALLNIALADAAIVSWDCKYADNPWRPITAIRQADQDFRKFAHHRRRKSRESALNRTIRISGFYVIVCRW